MIALSVIVPTYQRENSLKAILCDLMAQDVENLEIITVDQTPEPNCGMARFFECNADRIQRIVQTTPNLPMARNAGFVAASGELIFYVDDDVRLQPDCLRRLASRLIDGEADGVTAFALYNSDEENIWFEFLRGHGKPRTTPRDRLLQVQCFDGILMGFTRDVLEKTRGFDEQMGRLTATQTGEDHEFCRRAVSNGYRLCVDPMVVIWHEPFVPGGCQVRMKDPEVSRRDHLLARVYMEMKSTASPGHLGVKSCLQLLRGTALNRELLSVSGLPRLVRAVKELRSSIRHVRKFVESAW